MTSSWPFLNSCAFRDEE